jgi:hypothetical protein
MLITRSRALAAAAAGALLLAPLAGCGSDDKAQDADGRTASSATASPSASTSPTDGESADSGVEGAAAPGEQLTTDNLVATMLAAMREQKTAHMTMDIGSSISAEADVRYAGDSTDMKMSMDMGASKVEVIMVDGVMYMQQSAGGKYVKIGRDDPAMGNLLDQMSSFGPESSVAAMRGAVKKVEQVGSETVDGDKVTRYRVTVDSTSIAKTFGAGAADLPKSLTYDLYVDDDHLMRRIDMTVSEQEISMKVSRWGEPVDIAAPPASQLLSQ